jgi:DNA-binding Lrp family transcriptional regulator
MLHSFPRCAQHSFVDDIDHALLLQLMQNCRQTNTELAERVGLTPAPCLRRVRRLEEEGIVLGYHAHVQPAAIDMGFAVLVDIELSGHDQPTVQRFEDALIALDEVVEARRMFGAPDYHARIAVKDLAAYEQFLSNKLMALPGLARLQSRFPMKTLKDASSPIG